MNKILTEVSLMDLTPHELCLLEIKDKLSNYHVIAKISDKFSIKSGK